MYQIKGIFDILGAAVNNPYTGSIAGSLLFPVVMISIIFVFMLFIVLYKSNYKNKWKIFSVLSLVTISSVAGVLFLNRYMYTRKGIRGGLTKMPDSDFFNNNSSATKMPEPAFFDLFE